MRPQIEAELWKHKMARPVSESITWCVCLGWSVDRDSLGEDERRHNDHVSSRLWQVVGDVPAFDRSLDLEEVWGEGYLAGSADVRGGSVTPNPYWRDGAR